MIAPDVFPRMKQRSDSPRLRIDSREVRPFVQIAVDASECEIFQVIRSAVSFRNNVFNVENGQRRITLFN